MFGIGDSPQCFLKSPWLCIKLVYMSSKYKWKTAGNSVIRNNKYVIFMTGDSLLSPPIEQEICSSKEYIFHLYDRWYTNVTTGFWGVYKVASGSNICVIFVTLASQFSYFIKSPISHIYCKICTVVKTSFLAMIETCSFYGADQEVFSLMTEADWIYETVGLGDPQMTHSVQSNGSV
jgi:hypothetical protein